MRQALEEPLSRQSAGKRAAAAGIPAMESAGWLLDEDSAFQEDRGKLSHAARRSRRC